MRMVYNLKKAVAVLALMMAVPAANAQLFVGAVNLFGNYNADSLVNNVLLSGGVNVSNVLFDGSNAVISCNAIGKFSTGSAGTNLGIQSGIIMSTGSVMSAVGPNNLGSTTGTLQNCITYTDATMGNLMNNDYNDLAVLEFDFVPWSDTLKFRYVFASEEYPEYVGSEYNDAFGFFVTGLNPNGGTYNNKNIALVPGTSNVPITINNVNGNSYSQYYVDNTNGLTIQYDGFTTVLTATVVLVPYNSYHMKLAIADAGDSSYDSAVFLEANSFSTNFEQEIEVNYVYYPDIPAGTYYCSQGPVQFSPVTNCNYNEMVWYFGDGGMAYGDTVYHVYGYPGFYTVTNVIRNPHRAENDSMYIERVIEIREIKTEITETVCNEYVWVKEIDGVVDSVVINYSGTYIDTLTNSIGCDSIVTLNLTVNTAPSPEHLYGNVTMQIADDMQNGVYIFSIDPVPGATSYEWLLTGDNPWTLQTSEAEPLQCKVIAAGIGEGFLEVRAYSECGVGSLISRLTASPYGVEEMVDNTLSIMPNPTTGRLVISLNGIENATATVFNSNGQKVDEFAVSGSQFVYSMDNLENGLYFFSINADGKQYSKKIVLAR